ncbi:MAG TPA: GMC family oxidoreductase [Solirubrobacterales bacterium]|nr:GMC family oxidoreductase [Solirubrobacterales bacterium]
MGDGEEGGGVGVLSESQRATLTAVCDAVVPSLPRDRDPDGLWARKASDLGVDEGAAQLISEIPDPELRGGLIQLLEALGGQGITRASQPSREQILRNIALSDPRAAAGVSALIGMTLFLHYGAPDPATGQNPNWRTLRYPGPLSAPPDAPKTLQIHEPGSSGEVLDADVCIVGSGSGGAVVAAVLAARGMDVVVLESAGYFNESDFTQLELPAYQRMYWRGGPTPTADGNVGLLAGTTLGGGTTINWTNCLRTRPWVREEWAGEHGLEGLDGPDFDRHLDAVWGRISANDECSDLNGTQQRLREGAEALGWSFETIVRNADRDSYSPETAGYIGFGDQSGSKRSADRTWLADAQEHGARFLTQTKATRVLADGGRAAGVEAAWECPDGRSAAVTVRAPRVVVACGSLESPALLLRSGLGGPAVGANLLLHPSSVVGAAYGTDQRAWWGPPQAGLCDEFADTGEGYGFLIETSQYAPGLIGSATPWISGADHKQRMEEFRLTATFIGLTRDRTGGRVAIDANGEAVPTYAVTDPLDLRNLQHGIEVQIRLHEAAGAHQIGPLAAGAPTWRRGDDLESFIARVKRIPFRAGGHRLFSAHQMGTCRMGKDPATSVAGPSGELHDTRGVWIGDGSAFPSSSGTNPMVTIMALAHRTAEAIATEAGADATAEKSEAAPA